MCDSHHVLELLPLNQSLSLGPPERRFRSNNKIGQRRHAGIVMPVFWTGHVGFGSKRTFRHVRL